MPAVLRRLRLAASKARLRRRSDAPSPPPPILTPEQLLVAKLDAKEAAAQLADAEVARRLAEELAQEVHEAERADEQLARDLVAAELAAQEAERAANDDLLRRIELEDIDAQLRRKNGVFECGLCCEEYFRGELLVACPEGHPLCGDCAQRGARAAFEMMDASLCCLADPDCQACYLDDEARKFLDEPQWVLVEKLRRERDLAILNSEGLVQCPFCPYAVTIDAGEAATTLDCLNPDCARRTCLKCKHVDHGTTPCALANPSAVHRLEEQMSDALIRKCPKCFRPYLKQDGCNRIVCSTCKTMSCYLCQKVIKGYEHFNDEPGPCKGKLWKDKQILANVEAARTRGLALLETEEERAHARLLKVS